MNYGIAQGFTDNLGKELGDLEIKEPIETLDEKTEDKPIEKEEKKPIEYAKPDVEKKPIEKEEPILPEWNDEEVLKYINKDKETTFESIDDVYKTKEVEKIVDKEVNPWEDVMDETDKAYYKFKRETNRSRKDFDLLNQDISKISLLDMAISRVRKDTGMKLSNTEAKNYLESKLNIDLDSDEISVNDKIELNTYAKPYKDALESDKEKYRTPLESVLKAQKAADVEMVKLEDGREIPKEQYNNFISQRNEYIDNVKKAVDSVTPFDFNIEIDDNGEKRKIDFSYEPSKEDKHSMLSDASDVDAMIAKRYQTKEGFNHKKLAEGLWWGDPGNQQKVIKAAMEKARAETIEEMLSDGNNENFGRRTLPKTKKSDDGYGTLTTGNAQNGFGVKFSGFGKPQ